MNAKRHENVFLEMPLVSVCTLRPRLNSFARRAFEKGVKTVEELTAFSEADAVKALKPTKIQQAELKLLLKRIHVGFRVD